jgi:hypothetical protein
VLGDDTAGPHSTAIVVGSKTVIACANSLNPVRHKEGEPLRYLENYWIQDRFTRMGDGTITVEKRVPISLYKYNDQNDWAVFSRSDGGRFPLSEIAAIDKTALADPSEDLLYSDAIVAHCPVALGEGIMQATEFSVGCQVSAVHIQSQSSHHIKYEGRDVVRGSSGGAVFVYPSAGVIGMHTEAIHEVEWSAMAGPEEAIEHGGKRSSSDNPPYEPIQTVPEPAVKKRRILSETVASLAGGNGGMGSALVLCKFPRLLHYIKECESA